MRWTSIKVDADAKLDGVKVRVERNDNSVAAVILRDTAGNMLKIAIHSYNVIGVYIPAPPETEKKHVLKGTMLRIPVREVFDDLYTAKERLKELTAGGEDGVVLAIEVEDVPVEPEEKPDDGIPF